MSNKYVSRLKKTEQYGKLRAYYYKKYQKENKSRDSDDFSRKGIGDDLLVGGQKKRGRPRKEK